MQSVVISHTHLGVTEGTEEGEGGVENDRSTGRTHKDMD